MGSGPVEVLVVDSAAFIRGYQVQNYCKKAVTVKEVISEIKDARTRQNLQVLPYELEVREPRSEAIHHVTDFAKKTGDFAVLSWTDLKVLALAYELECQLGPQKGGNLRKQPLQKVEYTDSWMTAGPTMPGVIGGAHLKTSSATPTSVKERQGDSPKQQEELETVGPTPPVEGRDVERRTANLGSGEVVPGDNTPLDIRDQLPEEKNEGMEIGEGGDVQELPRCEVGDVDLDDGDNRDGDGDGDFNGSDGDGSDDDDCDVDVDVDGDGDDDGWITPENVQQAKKDMGGLVEACLEGVVVGCMTNDFAMQNVLLQLGLHIVSTEGLLIKEVRTYLLQCKGCFKTTSDMTKVFCPTCGNKTLIRVIVNIDANGGRSLKPLSEKQFSTRGIRYSQPKMKGGRHANNPVVVADQRITYCQPRKKGAKVDVFSPDYVSLSSPFAVHDVTSRGANISFSKGSRHVPKNPNEVRKKGKRKK